MDIQPLGLGVDVFGGQHLFLRNGKGWRGVSRKRVAIRTWVASPAASFNTGPAHWLPGQPCPWDARVVFADPACSLATLAVRIRAVDLRNRLHLPYPTLGVEGRAAATERTKSSSRLRLAASKRSSSARMRFRASRHDPLGSLDRNRQPFPPGILVPALPNMAVALQRGP
jgi:hypothetical protein